MRRQPLFRTGLAAIVVLLASAVLIRAHFFVSAQGSRLAYGDTVSGTVDSGEDVETWQFDGLRDDVVRVQVTRTSGDLIPELTLTDPDGVLLVNLEWPDQGPATAQFSASLRQSGAHTLTIGGSGDTTGAYSLSLELQQAATRFEDGVIAYGRTVSGEISDTSFRQVWSFRGSPGDVIDVTMQATSGDLDSFVSLLSPEGDVLYTADTGGVGQDAALLAVKLPLAGTYSIAARRAGDELGERGTTSGTYYLTLTLRSPGMESGQETPIAATLGQEMRGRLNADAPTALYRVESGGVLSLGLTLSDPDRLGTVTVMTPAQALLGAFSGSTPLRTSVVLPSSGTVWIEVAVPDLSDQSSVDFALTVDHLTAATGTSRPLNYGVPQVSALDAVVTEAWHFAGHPGDLVRIAIQPTGPILDGTFTISAPDGTPLVQRTIEQGLKQALVLAADGLYEVLVEPRAASGGYQIEVDLDGVEGRAFAQRAIPQEKGPLPTGLGLAISSDLASAASEAWTLDLAAPQRWQFDLEQQTGGTPVGLAIESPDGSTLQVVLTDSLTRQAQTQVSLAQIGRYRLVVFDPSGSAPHSYSLRGELIEGGSLVLDTPSKGVITADRPADTWWIDTLPGSLLNVRIETLAGSSPPAGYVFDQAGRLVVATTQVEQTGSLALSGIPTAQGGRFRIAVVEHDAPSRVVYRIAASVVTPYAPASQLQDGAAVTVPAVFVAPAVPVPGHRQISVADEIIPPITSASDFLMSARRIDLESLVRGEMPSGAPYQAWTFAVSSGQMLGFSVVALDGTGAPGLVLLDQSATVLAEIFENSGRTTVLNYHFASGGFYTAAVRLDPGQRYTLWIDTLDEVDDTVSQVIDGRPLDYGDTLFDELEQPDEQRAFVFYGHAGDVITAHAVQIAGKLRMNMVLAGIGGNALNEVTAEEAGLSVRLDNITLREDSLYQIVLRSDSLAYGAFALTLNLKQAGAAVEHAGGRLDDTVLAGLSTTDTVHNWIFAGQAGESVSLTLEPLTPGGPASLELKLADSAGHVFVRRPSRLGHGTLTLDNILLPHQGIYQVIVTGGQRQSGLYRLSLSRNPANVGGVEQPISYGATAGNVLTRENFIDVWTFAGTAGDTVSIRARRIRGDAAPLTLQLRTRDGQVLATAGDTGGSTIDHTVLPLSGHYSIIVGNPDQTFDGEMVYELTINLEDSLARSMGSVLEYGETVAGSFYVDDPSDTWLFEGQAGDIVTLAASGGLPTLSLYSTDWHVASQTGQADLLAEVQAVESQPAQLDVVLPVSGPYAVTLRDTSQTNTQYTLSVVLNSASPTAANLVRPDQPRSGEIGATAPVQVWSFAGVRNTTISLTVTPDTRSDLAPRVTLSTADGTILVQAQAPVGHVAQITAYPINVEAEYLVSVSRALSSEGRTGGRYELLVEQTAAAAPNAQATLYGKRQIGLLNGSTPAESWSFEGQQGDTVTVSVQATSGDLDPVVAVYDAAGQLIATGDDQQGLDANLRLALPQDGTYIAEARRYEGALGTTSGNYSLSVDLVYRSGSASEQWLVYGDRVVSTVDGDQPGEQWSFTGEAGDVIHVDLQFAQDDSPLLLSLSDPAGTELATGIRDRGDAIIDGFTLPARGSYLLSVVRPGDARAAFSPYSLELDLLDAQSQTLAQGGVLALDRPAAGQFTAVPATQLWTFEAAAGDSVALALTRLRGLLSAQLTLVAPDGSPITTLSAVPGSTNTLTTGPLTLPLAGVYTLLVSGDEQALGLTYRLWLQPAAPVLETAQVLAPLQDGFGTIDALAPQAAWTFEAQAGETLSLRVGATGGDLAPTLTLWGPDQRPLMKGSASGTQASLLGFVAPQDGTYRVIVGRSGGVAGSTSGTYRLMLRREWISERAVVAQDVPFGTRQTGILAGDSVALYAFQGAAGDVIGLSVSVDEGNVPDLTLETEAGVAINVPLSKFDHETDLTAFALPAEGRYIVALQGSQPYTFSLFRRGQEIAGSGLVRNLGRGQAFVEAVQAPGQTTQWNFDGEAGEVLILVVDSAQSALRADLALYGPRGYLASATGDPDSSLVTLGPVRLPESGAYQLVVGAWLGTAGTTSGAYSVRVQTADPGESGSAGGHIPVLNTVVNGGLTAADAQDLWTFDGRAGEVITVRADQSSAAGSLSLELAAPDGSVLGTGQSGSAEIPLITLPMTGVYQIRVAGQVTAESSIEYRLAVILSQNTLVASMASAQGIAYGDQPGGTFQPGQDRQAWVFFGQMGEQAAAQVDPSSDTVGLAVYLLAPDGQVVVANAGRVPGHTVELGGTVLPQSGFYGLIVERGGDLGTSEEYHLKLSRIAGGALQQGALDVEASGWLTDAAPVHQWALAPAYSGDYVVQLEPLSPVEHLDLFIELASGQVVAAGTVDEQGLMVARARLESDQTYAVLVSGGLLVAQGQYTLRWQPAQESPVSATLSVALPNIGRITTEHFSNEWQIAVTAGAQVVAVTPVSGDLIPLVSVYDVNGILVRQQLAERSTALEVEVDFPADGIYRIVVSRARGAAGQSKGDYTIIVRPPA